MKYWISSLSTLLFACSTALAQAPQPAADAAGPVLFANECASCHTTADNARAPSLAMMRGLQTAAVVTAMETGKMAVQGERLNAEQKIRVAEFVTGRPLVTGEVRQNSLCATQASIATAMQNYSWNGWGADDHNTRFQPTAAAGMTAGEVPKLQLAWAFGFENALAARTQPAVIGNWLFTGAETGEVYALDAVSGCTRWSYKAQAAVRTAMTVVAQPLENGDSRFVVLFGDGQAHAYALDAQSGTPLWITKIEEHPNGSITAAPAVHQGRAYFAVSAAGEEVRGSNAEYACCSFRGSISALDLATGEVTWKSYSIDAAPSPRGRSERGVELLGPAGAGIWGAPTIDARRNVLYVGTGNGFAEPVQLTTNAILALDLDTGERRWAQQTVPGDVWLYRCDGGNAGNPNCPTTQGPDFDFGTAPLLTAINGRDILVVPQKSGMLYALDPDNGGAKIWEHRIGQGSAFGAQWGAATDGINAYVGVSDTQTDNPGGIHAIDLSDG
jgi:polyvinyl alcohol dehydrogenase (cytochrome)